MLEGSMRADVNVSVCRPGDYEKYQETQDFSHLILRRHEDEIRVIGMDGALRHTFPAGVGSVPELAADLDAWLLAREADGTAPPQALFPVLQGNVFDDLRLQRNGGSHAAHGEELPAR